MQLNIRLDKVEARVFGVLIEKALTTPEYYPLTLAAVTTAANQKTNRDPVMNLEEPEVAESLESLAKKFLVRRLWPSNSRVEKYAHNGKDALGLEVEPLAVLAELLLRGAQTPGELRTHVSRMVPVPSLEALYQMIQPLLDRGLATRLPPAPGSRAERYAQVLCPTEATTADTSPLREAPDEQEILRERVKALELRLARAERQIRRLAHVVGMSMEALAEASRDEGSDPEV
ncbi:MAG: YceH family protein [Candidatus Binatia bacterium]|nr:YceH family protein [Candidatus Binatia bacterium]